MVTGGIVTVKDSGWLMSWTINRQPQFRSQPKDHCLVWVYALFTDKPGDYVKKPMRECTGKEICMEWLYHIGVPEDQIEELAEHSANTVPVMMPYIDAFFMPRAYGDRPNVVPDGAVNFAFLGQFAETPRDTIFTTEYSMRTGMEAVYTLLNVDRGVPEVWGSVYDVRDLLNATVQLRDGKKATDMDVGLLEKLAFKAADEQIFRYRHREAAEGIQAGITKTEGGRNVSPPFSLSKKILTSWWTGEQAPPPGAASQIFGLSRRQFRLRRNLKTLWVFSLPATPTEFLLKSFRFPGAKTARKFERALALSSAPRVFRQSERRRGETSLLHFFTIFPNAPGLPHTGFPGARRSPPPDTPGR